VASGGKSPLRDDERRALYDAAEAGGFDKELGDLLCKLAEIYGFERIRRGLEKVQAEMKALGLLRQDPSR
jgi:hypothetical protein